MKKDTDQDLHDWLKPSALIVQHVEKAPRNKYHLNGVKLHFFPRKVHTAAVLGNRLSRKLNHGMAWQLDLRGMQSSAYLALAAEDPMSLFT